MKKQTGRMNSEPTSARRRRGFEHVSEEFRCYGVEGFIPQRATRSSAGYDIKTPIDFSIAPGKRVLVCTNIKTYMRPDERLEVHVRSSTGIKKHIILSNSTGVIDMDFYGNPKNDGNIALALWNTGTEIVEYKRGDAICQGIFTPYLTTDNDRPVSEKRLGGIGSTDKQ